MDLEVMEESQKLFEKPLGHTITFNAPVSLFIKQLRYNLDK